LDEKEFSEFPVNRANKDGLAYRCKQCNNRLSREWRQKYPEKNRAISAKQQQKLKARDPDYWNRWARENYATESGRAKRIAIVQERRARLLGAEGSYTAEQFAELCVLYGGVCLACGGFEPLTVDHVIPLSMGGSNHITNIQPLCKPCNSRKGTKSVDYRDLAS
jgi:5-methylcytosine-specific restriction endonuclease McrA